MTDVSTTSWKLTFLRVTAVLVAIISVLQPILAVGPLTKSGPLNALHGPLGEGSFVIAILVLVAAWLWGKESGNKGLIGHAASLPILALVQTGLGMMMSGGFLEVAHIGLGFAYLLAAVSLATLAFRKPFGNAPRASRA